MRSRSRSLYVCVAGGDWGCMREVDLPCGWGARFSFENMLDSARQPPQVRFMWLATSLGRAAGIARFARAPMGVRPLWTFYFEIVRQRTTASMASVPDGGPLELCIGLCCDLRHWRSPPFTAGRSGLPLPSRHRLGMGRWHLVCEPRRHPAAR